MKTLNLNEYKVTLNFDNTKSIGYKYDKKLPYLSNNGKIKYNHDIIYSLEKIDDSMISSTTYDGKMFLPYLVNDQGYYFYHYLIRAWIKRSITDYLKEDFALFCDIIPNVRLMTDRYIFIKENKIKLEVSHKFNHAIKHKISIDNLCGKYNDRVYEICPKSCTFTMFIVDGCIDEDVAKLLLDSVVGNDKNNVTSYTITPIERVYTGRRKFKYKNEMGE